MNKIAGLGIDCLVSSSNLVIVVIGFYLIYGIMKVINMAHGDMVMLGSYLTASISTTIGSFWVSVGLASIICFMLGYLIEIGIIRRLYDKENIMTLLATWGLSLIFIEFVRLFFGASGIYVDPPFQGVFRIGNLPFSLYNILIIGIAIFITIVVSFLFQYTKLGVLVRAAIENPNRAQQFGINIQNIYSITFATGTGLAGLAGGILSPVSAITPNMGIDYAFLSFLVVITGGFKSFLSLIIGSITIACTQTILSSFFDLSISTIGMLILVLLIIYIRPGGILPEQS